VILDQAQVETLIPHRAPFLFVKSAVVVSTTEIRGIVVWDTDNPAFEGHFPGFPIVPGVLMVEAAAQLAGVLIAYQATRAAANADGAGEKAKRPLGMLVGVRRASFHKPVYPDVPVHYSVKLGNAIGGMASISAEAADGEGARVFKGEVNVAAVDSARLTEAAALHA
jgi:3-hydroxyacyl-[acyl-carrier-protein] dehydratase